MGHLLEKNISLQQQLDSGSRLSMTGEREETKKEADESIKGNERDVVLS